MTNLINWSEVSRQLAQKGNRSQIKSTYSGRKYAEKVNAIKELEKEIVKIIENKFIN